MTYYERTVNIKTGKKTRKENAGDYPDRRTDEDKGLKLANEKAAFSVLTLEQKVNRLAESRGLL